MMLAHSILISTTLPLEEAVRAQLSSMRIAIPVELERATQKRKEEFLAGRYCAVTALLKAGCSTPSEVRFREDHSPGWPAEWVGSITHAKAFAAAAVAPSICLRGLGIDCEPVMSLTTAQKVSSRILTGQELDQADDPKWVTLVFSAKESIYKCLRPLCGRFFGFEDAEIFQTNESGHFRFRLKNDIGGGFQQGWEGSGRFEKTGNLIHTAVELLN